MEKIDIEDFQVNKQLSVGTRMERASARSAEVIVKENQKFYKCVLAAGAVLVLVAAAQFGMNLVALSLEKEIFVTADGSGPHIMQDRAGNPLAMPLSLTTMDPYEGLPLAGPTAWDAISSVNLQSADGALQSFKLSGWRLDEDKTEVGAYQLTLMTVSGATLTYARSVRPRPAAMGMAPFEWASSGDNIIRIQHPDGRETLAGQSESGRRLKGPEVPNEATSTTSALPVMCPGGTRRNCAYQTTWTTAYHKNQAIGDATRCNVATTSGADLICPTRRTDGTTCKDIVEGAEYQTRCYDLFHRSQTALRAYETCGLDACERCDQRETSPVCVPTEGVANGHCEYPLCNPLFKHHIDLLAEYDAFDPCVCMSTGMFGCTAWGRPHAEYHTKGGFGVCHNHPSSHQDACWMTHDKCHKGLAKLSAAPPSGASPTYLQALPALSLPSPATIVTGLHTTAQHLADNANGHALDAYEGTLIAHQVTSQMAECGKQGRICTAGELAEANR